MKCRYCKANIPEGEMYCSRCGKEVYIVPEYNPWDDMLTEEVKVGIDDDRRTGVKKASATRTGNSERVRQGTRANVNRNTGTRRSSDRQETGRSHTGRTTGRMDSERERRIRQAKKQAKIRKKRIKVLVILLLILVAMITAIVLTTQNSYAGIVKKGNKALQKQNYDVAATCFQNAIKKDAKKADAYIGLSKVYIAQDKKEEAEAVFTDVLKDQPQNIDLYEACFDFYLENNQNMKIPAMLDELSDSTLDKLSDYVVDGPEFSLDDSETFDDVQELTLSSDHTVYYTTDGSDPTFNSSKYSSEGIQIEEGETVVKAIAVNKKGIPSTIVKKTYTVEFPVEDAPAVSPSTGQYDKDTKITVKVPDGYTAYYTTNGETPTSASKKYSEPIDMPEGETLFKVVLVNAKGRMSGVTTRNYLLEK